jgi:hypothetical protein
MFPRNFLVTHSLFKLYSCPVATVKFILVLQGKSSAKKTWKDFSMRVRGNVMNQEGIYLHLFFFIHSEARKDFRINTLHPLVMCVNLTPNIFLTFKSNFVNKNQLVNFFIYNIIKLFFFQRRIFLVKMRPNIKQQYSQTLLTC